MKQQKPRAQDWLIDIVNAMINDYTLNQMIEDLEELSGINWDLEVAAEVWKVAAGLLLEFELPMLKGDDFF